MFWKFLCAVSFKSSEFTYRIHDFPCPLQHMNSSLRDTPICSLSLVSLSLVWFKVSSWNIWIRPFLFDHDCLFVRSSYFVVQFTFSASVNIFCSFSKFLSHPIELTHFYSFRPLGPGFCSPSILRYNLRLTFIVYCLIDAAFIRYFLSRMTSCMKIEIWTKSSILPQ